MQNRSSFALFRFEVKNFPKAKSETDVPYAWFENDVVLNARSSVRVNSSSWRWLMPAAEQPLSGKALKTALSSFHHGANQPPPFLLHLSWARRWSGPTFGLRDVCLQGEGEWGAANSHDSKKKSDGIGGEGAISSKSKLLFKKQNLNVVFH